MMANSDYAIGKIIDPIEIPYFEKFNSNEFRKIKSGFIAESSDDRWNFRFVNSVLWIDRSWTRLTYYCLQFTEITHGAQVSKTICPREFFELDPEETVPLLNWIIQRILLGKDIPFYR